MPFIVKLFSYLLRSALESEAAATPKDESENYNATVLLRIDIVSVKVLNLECTVNCFVMFSKHLKTCQTK